MSSRRSFSARRLPGRSRRQHRVDVLEPGRRSAILRAQYGIVLHADPARTPNIDITKFVRASGPAAAEISASMRPQARAMAPIRFRRMFGSVWRSTRRSACHKTREHDLPGLVPGRYDKAADDECQSDDRVSDCAGHHDRRWCADRVGTGEAAVSRTLQAHVAQFGGTDWAFGGTAGITLEPQEGTTIGLGYRSQT